MYRTFGDEHFYVFKILFRLAATLFAARFGELYFYVAERIFNFFVDDGYFFVVGGRNLQKLIVKPFKFGNHIGLAFSKSL